MLNEFVHSPKHIQSSHLREFAEQDRHAKALSDEHRSPRRIRTALGLRLVLVGERLIDRNSSELGSVDKAA